MGFGEAVRTCLRQYAVFQGRAPRPEYWWFALFALLAGLVAAILDAALFPAGAVDPLASIVNLLLLLPSLGVSVRRLHDIGRSGWWLLIVLVPLVGAIVLIVWFCQKSDLAPNRHGPVPRPARAGAMG